MALSTLLVANRGEIAVRVLRGAAQAGLRTVAVYSPEDVASLHTRIADDSLALHGRGSAAYLDIDQIVAAAVGAGADAVHPGYGFLAENADFAAACEAAGLTFVGPTPDALRLFGEKSAARALAQRSGVPTLDGTAGPTSLDDARAFLASLGPGGAVMVKAAAGGGGRGMRAVTDAAELDSAYERCRSEARAAFGSDEVYVERYLPHARHIEVQIVGDGAGEVTHLWERECSLQRRNQKLIEVAPSPTLSETTRQALVDAAVALGRAAHYRSLGTVEFLLDASDPTEDSPDFFFIEANARIQVEHTVTEEVTGVDLVVAQLRLAGGASLADVGLDAPPAIRGFAVQARVNTETMSASGDVLPQGGTLVSFEVPSGPGVRTDTYGYAGYTTSPAFDSLLAKVIGWSPSNNYADAVARTARALAEFRIEGVTTNIALLRTLLEHRDVVANRITTRFVEDNVAELVAATPTPPKWFSSAASPAPTRLAGVKVNDDPLAVLAHGKSSAASAAAAPAPSVAAAAPSIGPDGSVAVQAPLQGTIVSVDVVVGDLVAQGSQVLVMEAMKMEHVIVAPVSGRVVMLGAEVGDAVFGGHGLVFIEEAEVDVAAEAAIEVIDLDYIRPDLAEVLERHAITLDEHRPDKVAKRHARGHRTARENVEDLVDPGTFVEYAPLVVAPQRRRRSLDDLIENTPADGMIAGIGQVNGAQFDERTAQTVLMSYDYMVLAGTQGGQNHRKKDRMFELAEMWRLPVVLYAEGGGGRPGDTDGLGVAGLDCLAFQYFARLSGLVPLVGITNGRCFAGNAVLLGCCDVVIATKGSNIGVGGPAMIEGGGLGIFTPDEVGPMDIQVPNGVVDIEVEDEAEATAVAKKYLSYFQGRIEDWSAPDQRLLRRIIPENRLRVYDVREVISTLADTDSVLEIRQHFGIGMVTSLARIEGRPIGIIANNPHHLAGAVDSDAADKAARFMQLCDAYDIPLVILCDCPGIMVGPEVEKTAVVRHAARMFVTSASVTVPVCTIVLRKGYGLGAQAMAAGSFKATYATVSWPTGEFGGMGLEGAVKLGYRKELEAEEDPAARKDLYDKMVDDMYRRGKAVNTASHFEIDDVIDPMESRRWIMSMLRSIPPPPARDHKKRPCIDTW